MNIYSVRYYSTELITLLGDVRAMASICNMLENNKIRFKVADVAGFNVQPSHFGWNSFNYWMAGHEVFTSDQRH